MQPAGEKRGARIRERLRSAAGQPPRAKRDERDEREQAGERVRARHLAVVDEQRRKRDQDHPDRARGKRRPAREHPGARQQQPDAGEQRRRVHAPFGQADRAVQPLVIEGERNAVIRVAEMREDVRGTGAQQLVDGVPLVVDEDLDVELPRAQRRARDKGGEQQQAPRRHSEAGAGPGLPCPGRRSSTALEKMRGFARPMRHRRYCALTRNTPRP